MKKSMGFIGNIWKRLGQTLRAVYKFEMNKVLKPVAIAMLLLAFMMAASGVVTITDTTISGTVNLSVIGDQNFTAISFGTDTLNRPFSSNAHKSVSVCAAGCTYTTIQDAVDKIPFYNRHQYHIEVRNGVYDENVTLPAIFGGSQFVPRTKGEGYAVRFIGNVTDPTMVKVRSLRTNTVSGVLALHINGFEFYGEHPYDDENSALGIYGGSGVVALGQIRINCTNLRKGIVVYNGRMAAGANITFFETQGAAYNCSEYGIFTKYRGEVFLKGTGSEGAHGNVQGWAYGATSGGYINFNDLQSTLTGDSGLALASEGWIRGWQTGSVWGIDTFMNSQVNVTGKFEVVSSTLLRALVATNINTGLGVSEIYPMDQSVNTTSAVVFATVNTGQGPNDLYDMDQNVKITSLPTFDTVVASDEILIGAGYGSTGSAPAKVDNNNDLEINGSIAQIGQIRNSANGAAAWHNFVKSRDGDVITTGDDLMVIAAKAHDGTDFTTIGAKIIAESGGTIATQKIPTSIQFHTANGTATDDVLEKMRITPDGYVGIGTKSPATKLDVNGSITVTGEVVATANIQATGDLITTEDLIVSTISTCTGSCTTGSIAWNTTRICVCTTTNTWKTAELS